MLKQITTTYLIQTYKFIKKIIRKVLFGNANGCGDKNVNKSVGVNIKPINTLVTKVSILIKVLKYFIIC